MKKTYETIAEKIDAILPQTQCGLCSFDGCRPYAEALATQQAEINLCPPGGVPGLKKLGELLQINPEPYLAEMQEKTKPRQTAVIREQDCIGCVKCIKACPVDAILGSAKQIHTIISVECTGCELCIAPCPVDCIDLIPLPELDLFTLDESNHFRERYEAREKRLQKISPSKKTKSPSQPISDTNPADYIQAALLRSKSKKATSSSCLCEERSDEAI